MHEKIPWFPKDNITSPVQATALKALMDKALEEISNSEFIISFANQLETVKNHFQDAPMKMVIYGIGKFGDDEACRWQLCLALWLKQNVQTITTIECFDPVLSRTELDYLTEVGILNIGFNESCKRKVDDVPVIFFMPHCPYELYDNLLSVNWNVNSLKNIVVLGNSFPDYIYDFGSNLGKVFNVEVIYEERGDDDKADEREYADDEGVDDYVTEDEREDADDEEDEGEDDNDEEDEGEIADDDTEYEHHVDLDESNLLLLEFQSKAFIGSDGELPKLDQGDEDDDDYLGLSHENLCLAWKNKGKNFGTKEQEERASRMKYIRALEPYSLVFDLEIFKGPAFPAFCSTCWQFFLLPNDAELPYIV